jgi:hypothetical protein
MTSPQGNPEQPPPSMAQILAVIEQLVDDQPGAQAAARRRLLAWGEPARAALRATAEAGDVVLRLRARAALRAIDVRDSLQRFARLDLGDRGLGTAPALLRGAVLLSQMVRTFVPDAAELAKRLRGEAKGLRRAFAGRSLQGCARLLAERLHGAVGLQGGDASAAAIDHVSLDRVLLHGTGIPVSLSLLYLLVARWAGLSAAGIALPDHFLVRLHGVRPVLVDPYHGGRTVTKADCVRYLRAGGHDQVRDHVRDLSDREVLIHYLRALQRAASNPVLPEARRTLGRALGLLETS